MTALLPQELTCKRVVEIVTDYLEGRMQLPERTAFEHHLVSCVGCTVYLRQVKQTIAVAGAAKEPPGAAAQRELVRMFRGWRERK